MKCQKTNAIKNALKQNNNNNNKKIIRHVYGKHNEAATVNYSSKEFFQKGISTRGSCTSYLFFMLSYTREEYMLTVQSNLRRLVTRQVHRLLNK